VVVVAERREQVHLTTEGAKMKKKEEAKGADADAGAEARGDERRPAPPAVEPSAGTTQQQSGAALQTQNSDRNKHMREEMDIDMCRTTERE
jgi:hypothetical protein